MHKLMISDRRRDDGTGQAKARKDLLQAGEILEALVMVGRHHVVAPAFEEAWAQGPKWRQLIERGASRLPASTRQMLDGLSLPFPLPKASQTT